MITGTPGIDGTGPDGILDLDGIAGEETSGQYPMEVPGAILGMIHSGILGGDGTPGVQDGAGMQAGAGIAGPGMDGVGEPVQYGAHLITEDLFTWLIMDTDVEEMW